MYCYNVTFTGRKLGTTDTPHEIEEFIECDEDLGTEGIRLALSSLYECIDNIRFSLSVGY